MTPSRRDWRGKEAESRVTTHEAFGWKVHRHVLPVGGALVVVSSRSIERDAAPNLALYVRGRGVVTNSVGGQFDDRVPGLFTGERPDHPEGTTRITAAEELEFWCFNWHANRRALPDATPIRAPHGGPWRATAGQRVLVCAGAIGEHWAGDTFVSDGAELETAPVTYGLMIGGDRG